jgi:hypothetical protein
MISSVIDLLFDRIIGYGIVIDTQLFHLRNTKLCLTVCIIVSKHRQQQHKCGEWSVRRVTQCTTTASVVDVGAVSRRLTRRTHHNHNQCTSVIYELHK